MADRELGSILHLVFSELQQIKKRLNLAEQAVESLATHSRAIQSGQLQDLQNIDSATQALDCISIFIESITCSNEINMLVNVESSLSKIYLEDLRFRFENGKVGTIPKKEAQIEVF